MSIVRRFPVSPGALVVVGVVLAAFYGRGASAQEAPTILPPPPANVVVTPNGPWQPGANGFVAQGAGSGFDVFLAVEASSGMTVDALWALFEGRWVFLVPAIPALDGGFDEAIPAAPSNGSAPASLAAIAILSPRAVGPSYDVTVYFNESVTQSDMDEVQQLLRFYDPNVNVLILESFPPIGRATVVTEFPAFCDAIVGVLEAKSYVTTLSCFPSPVPLPPSPDPLTTIPML